MGGGMMGGGMMGRGMMGQGYGRCMMGPMAMRIIFSLMGANGDGKLSLEEFQAAHELQGNGCRPRWHRYLGGNAGFHARALAGRSPAHMIVRILALLRTV